jgi:hypothetical protein
MKDDKRVRRPSMDTPKKDNRHINDMLKKLLIRDNNMKISNIMSLSYRKFKQE